MTPERIDILGETILTRYERIINEIFVERDAVTVGELELLLNRQGMLFRHFEWVYKRCDIKLVQWKDPAGYQEYIWTKKG